jgi:DNA polymerase IV
MAGAPPVRILHLDVDAFFASVEQRDDTRLRGRPVAVGTGVVASCSYEARRRGVRTGMRLAEARRLCRGLVVLPGDYRRYEQAARRVLGVCHERTPLVEVAALDDLYLDLTHGPFPCEKVAQELADQVRAEVGLSASLGVGGGKFVAQVATQEAKDRRMGNGERGMGNEDKATLHSPFPVPRSPVVVVPPRAERAYLAPWPAEVLPGVGPQVRARLGRLNVRRVGEVAVMPLAALCGLFGERGRKLRELACGLDPRPVEPYRPPQSVSRRTSFEPPAADCDFLLAMLEHLLDRAASWLRFRGLATRGLALSVRYGDYRGADARASFPRATADEAELKAAARERFLRLYLRRLPLRLLGVELAPLRPPEAQAVLFPDPAAERARRLAECKDAIRQRFGFMSLLSGSALLLGRQLEHDRDNFRLRTPCLTR